MTEADWNKLLSYAKAFIEERARANLGKEVTRDQIRAVIRDFQGQAMQDKNGIRAAVKGALLEYTVTPN